MYLIVDTFQIFVGECPDLPGAPDLLNIFKDVISELLEYVWCYRSEVGTTFMKSEQLFRSRNNFSKVG